MKTLNDRELAEINRLDMAEELARDKIKISEQAVIILTLKQRLLAAEIEKSGDKLSELRVKESACKDARKSFLVTMQKKHKLKDGWGFDPTSGALKEI